MARSWLHSLAAAVVVLARATAPLEAQTKAAAQPTLVRPQPVGAPLNLAQFLRMADPASGGDLETALQLLGQYADQPTPLYTDRVRGPALYYTAQFLLRQPPLRRYLLLKDWTLPTPERQSVRILSAFSVPDHLPEAFRPLRIWDRTARERESDDEAPRGAAVRTKPEAPGPAKAQRSLPLAPCINTAELLIDAAREAGKLDELAAALETPVTANLDKALTLSLLVAVARGHADRVEPQVRQRTADYQMPPTGQADGRFPIAWEDYLVARACLAEPLLRPLGERLVRQMMQHAFRYYENPWITRLHHDLVVSAATAGVAAVAPNQDPGLALWHPGADESALRRLQGTVEPFWFAHDDHVVHVAGPGAEFLFFDYPLAGEFEFSVDAFNGGWGEANVGFGGLAFEVQHGGIPTRIWPAGRHEEISLPDPIEVRDEFNRITVQVRSDRVRCLVNGHLVYETTDPSPISPWLSLFANFSFHTLFRDATLTGQPRILPELALTHGNRLEGWIASYLGESQPPRLTVGRQSNPTNAIAAVAAPVPASAYSWSAHDGIIVSGQVNARPPQRSSQSRLYYHRPLRGGESLRYEFYYEPGRTEVHPALDRLVFLLDPEGVRLHWITDMNGRVDPWSGLADDNVVDDLPARRGPQPLPLKPGEWNAVGMSLAGDTVKLELNGVEIFQRSLESTNDRLFGFYHRAGESSVQVRNVALTGDWPKELSPAQMANLFGRGPDKLSAATRRARHALIEERQLVSNWENIQRRARQLPPAECYALLRSWVLPGPDHSTFRFLGGYTSTNPPPAAGAAKAANGPAAGGRPARRINIDGEMTAPVIDLLAVATELGKLGELANQALSAQTVNDADRRGKLALLVLVNLAQKNEEAVAGYLEQLRLLLDRPLPDRRGYARWPELVVASQLLGVPSLRADASELLEALIDEIQKQGIEWEWERRLRPLRDRARYLALPEADAVPFGTDPTLTQWSRVTHGTSWTQGKGFLMPHWSVAGHEVHHYCGHDHDYLYFQSPLRGNFEINCQLTRLGWRESQISYGGTFVGPRGTGRAYEISHYGRNESDGVIDPQLQIPGEWYDYRLVIQNGKYAAFVNGRLIHTQIAPANGDPWLAIHSHPNFSSGCRNLIITGNPVIPERLQISDLPDLTGWLTYFTGETAGGENADWRKEGEEIAGRKIDGISGSNRQSLLRYHRPLLEDGEMTYEFFYEPGQTHVDPALDRLVFLLDPEGLRIHWLTDGHWDRTGIPHDNVADEPAIRRGPQTLPLKAGNWNRVILSLRGDVVTLSLNGVEICQRALEATNQRDFGFFHYSSETGVRVRKVTYRGDWPRKFPSPAQQELANSAATP
jgi:hypothetical protein